MRMIAEKEEGLETWQERRRMYGVRDGVIGGWGVSMKGVDEAESAGSGFVEVGGWEGAEKADKEAPGGGGSAEM